MKHRKLFPSPDSTNGTDCSDFCFFYFEPPPPPSPVAVAVPDGAEQSTHGGVSPTLIVVVTLLASFALLVGYYVVVAKSCFGLFNRRNNNNNNNENENFSQSDGGDDEGLVDHENRAIDHHIWFITTVGLQQSIINSITVVKYKRNEGLIEGTECSVCLNEFREDETLRLLPKCSHAFHIPCIDKWLRSHTNCPLCRAHIVNDGNTNGRLESANRNGGDEIEDTQMGNSENGTTAQSVDQDVVNDIINSNRSCDLERGNDNGEIGGSDDQVRPLGRSVSMDSSSSSSAAAVVIAKEIGELESENIGRSNREVGDQDQKQCLRVSHVEMKRSLSCEGRFLSSSRPNQRLNSVHLPS